MAKKNSTFGLSFAVDISKLKSGLAIANKSIRESETEFKKAVSGMDDWRDSAEGLEARTKYLNTALNEHKQVIARVEKEKQRITETMKKEGKSQKEINDELDEANKILVKEYTAIEKINKELNDYTKKTDKAEKETKDLGGEVEKLNKSFSLKNLVKADLISKGISKLASSVLDLSKNLFNLADNTREYREDMNKLQTAFETAGFTADQAKNVYKDFYAVLGEEDRSVEAVNHLAKLVNTEQELQKWTDICAGVWATFGDSLPIEGLTEAANEVAKTGKLTGVLTDALNWAGVSEDEFQKKLDKCTTEQERQALITETLNDLYDEAAEKYKEINKDVMAAQKAQSELKDAYAKMGAIAEPIMTNLKTMTADLLNEIMPLVQIIGDGLLGALNGTEGATKKMADGITQIIDKTIEKVISFLPVALSTISEIIPQIAQSIITKLPELLDVVVFAISEAIYTINDSAPQVIQAISDIIPQLINKLLEAVPYLLEGAITLFHTLIDGLAVTLVNLVSELPKIIQTIQTTFSEMDTQLYQLAVDFFFQILEAIPVLIDELAKALPSIFETITSQFTKAQPEMFNKAKDLLMQIVKALPGVVVSLTKSISGLISTLSTQLSKSAPAIMEGAYDMLFGIIEAIPEIVKELIKAIPQINNAIFKMLLQAIPQLIQIGNDLISGLFKGMMSGIGKGVQAIGQNMINWFKSFFGIHSPSKKMSDEIGFFNGQGLAVGMLEGYKSKMRGLNDFILSSIDAPSINYQADHKNVLKGQSRNVIVNQYNTFAKPHSRYEIFKAKQETAAAVRLALGGIS